MSSYILRGIDADLFTRAKAKAGDGSLKPIIEHLLAEWVKSTSKTATERMEGARAAHRDTLASVILWAAIGSRLWPSFLAPPGKADAMFPWVLCIDSPAGRIAYRLTEADLPAFAHVVRLEQNDQVPCSKDDRMARLLHLATEGW